MHACVHVRVPRGLLLQQPLINPPAPCGTSPASSWESILRMPRPVLFTEKICGQQRRSRVGILMGFQGCCGDFDDVIDGYLNGSTVGRKGRRMARAALCAPQSDAQAACRRAGQEEELCACKHGSSLKQVPRSCPAPHGHPFCRSSAADQARRLMAQIGADVCRAQAHAARRTTRA